MCRNDGAQLDDSLVWFSVVSLCGICFTYRYRFVIHTQEFDDHRDADDAVYELNGKELMGERYARK